MQRTLRSQVKAVLSTSPFPVDRSRALSVWDKQDAECGGSGHENVVTGIPEGPPWPGVPQGRVMLSCSRVEVG